MNIADAQLMPDAQLVRRAFERSAGHSEDAAFLLRSIGERLLERLDLLRLQPRRILDVGCGSGILSAQLLRKYRSAQLVAVERAPAMLHRAAKRAPWLRTLHTVCAELPALPFAAAQFDLIISNLALPWSLDLAGSCATWQRLLKPGGALLFSTLGAHTLSELRASWSGIDDAHTHVNAFFAMQDIGDALWRVGLTGVVVDVERLTLTYPNVQRLSADLAQLGARNMTHGRRRSLTGKGRWAALLAHYEQYRRSDGQLPVSCEVVYGHAWSGLAPQVTPPTSTVFPIRFKRVFTKSY